MNDLVNGKKNFSLRRQIKDCTANKDLILYIVYNGFSYGYAYIYLGDNHKFNQVTLGFELPRWLSGKESNAGGRGDTGFHHLVARSLEEGK